jgi:hypothetical protein
VKHANGLLAVFGLLLCPPALHAQMLFPPFLPGYSFANGFRFSYHSRHLGLGGFLGRSYYGWGSSPFFPYAGFAPYYFAPPRISIYYSAPPVMMNPPIIINQPIVVIREKNVDVTEDDRYIRIVPRSSKPAADGNRPGVARERVRRPEPQVKARSAPPRRPKPALKRKPPPTSAEWIARGKEAFQVQLYGLAERFFTAATKAVPADPTAFFFIAQARFSLRKYREAVEAIEAGLRAAPDWPKQPFHPEELYGANRGEFTDQLRHLQETLDRHPKDPDLLFLYAYELWFSGRPAQARAIFLRAAKVTPNRRFIDLFLRALPALPVAKR